MQQRAFKRLQSIFNDIQTRCFITEESPSHLSKDSKDPNGHSLQPASTEGDFHANLLQIDVLHFANQITESLLSELMAYVTAYTSVFAASFLEGDYNPEDTILNIVSDQAQMEGVDLELVELETCLIDLVRKVCDNFFLLTTRRFDLEKRCCCDTGVIVRALDRIYGRVQQFTRSYTEALYRMGPYDGLPTEQFTVGLFGQSSKETCTQLLQSAQSLVDDVARSRTEHHLSKICQSAVDSITELRQQLISPVVAGAIMSDSQSVYSGNTKNSSSPGCQLVPLFEKLNSSLTTRLHNGLSALQVFVNSENSFVARTRFSEQFCLHELRERLIVGYLKFLLKFFEDMAETAAGRVPGPILLLLAKLCLTWGQSGTVGHLLGLAEEILAAGSKPWLTPSNSKSTENRLASEGCWKFSLETQPISSKEMSDLFLDISTRLLVAFVRLEGTSLAQLLRKSVEARDWLKTLEPRSVRSVVKRLMDDIAALDAQIVQLLPSNTRGRDRLSDSRSSRSLISGIHASGSSHFLDRSGRPSTTSTGLVSRSTELDPSLATHLRRLFTQRVDIFDSVEGNRESLLLGVVKIGLKTLVESVRLQTFGKSICGIL
ncbi:unnamed protein product [Dicrocoelium dendriticum]|nr:unnamed protein product [Dicrocoelium dendriticum]